MYFYPTRNHVMDVFLLPTIFFIVTNFLGLPRYCSHPDTHLEGHVLDIPWGLELRQPDLTNCPPRARELS